MAKQARQFIQTFQKKYRDPLEYFFRNRERELTECELFNGYEQETIWELLRFNMLCKEYSGFRLDERVESFFEQMLETGDAAPVQWLETSLKDFDRWESLYHQTDDPLKHERCVAKLVRVLQHLRNRMLRQNSELQRAADYDYRTESDYEIKEAKLQWRLEETENLRAVLEEVDSRMRNSSLFRTNRDADLLHARSQMSKAIRSVGQKVIQSYQQIAEYINRVRRDHARVRKLIRLQDLIDRYELESHTNVADIAETLDGPLLVASFKLHTVLAPDLLDENPLMLDRVLDRKGIEDSGKKVRRVTLPQQEEPAEPEILIDAVEMFEDFSTQNRDLFSYLATVHLDGEKLEIEQCISIFCEVLTTPELLDRCQVNEGRSCFFEEWEYLEVLPKSSLL